MPRAGPQPPGGPPLTATATSDSPHVLSSPRGPLSGFPVPTVLRPTFHGGHLHSWGQESGPELTPAGPETGPPCPGTRVRGATARGSLVFLGPTYLLYLFLLVTLVRIGLLQSEWRDKAWVRTTSPLPQLPARSPSLPKSAGASPCPGAGASDRVLRSIDCPWPWGSGSGVHTPFRMPPHGFGPGKGRQGGRGGDSGDVTRAPMTQGPECVLQVQSC